MRRSRSVNSKTRDLGAVTREADILVAAIGRPGFIEPEMVKPGATLIDVGINRLTTREEFRSLFCGRRQARSSVCQARIDDRRGRASQGLRASGCLLTGARWSGSVDDRHVDVEYRACGQNASRAGVMLRVGLTGGLGKCKSTVGSYLRELGASSD